MTKTRFQVAGLFSSVALLALSLLARQALADPPAGCDQNKCVSDACFKYQDNNGQANCWGYLYKNTTNSTTQAFNNLYFSNGLGGGTLRESTIQIQAIVVQNCNSPCFVAQNGILAHGSNCYMMVGQPQAAENQRACIPNPMDQ